jgi:hypothetical protein
MDTPRQCFTRFVLCLLVVSSPGWLTAAAQTDNPRANRALRLPRAPNAKPRNIIFILTDDHRYDALGFMHPC